MPVLTDETGAVVMAEAPSSRVFVLADPDLLNTQGLRDANTFAAATQIVGRLREGDGPIIFDVTLNGYKVDRSALKLMFEPPFLASRFAWSPPWRWRIGRRCSASAPRRGRGGRSPSARRRWPTIRPS